MVGAAHGGRPSLFLTHMAADRTQDVADAATLANAPKPFAKSTYPSLARVQVLHCRAQKLRQGAPFADPRLGELLDVAGPEAGPLTPARSQAWHMKNGR